MAQALSVAWSFLSECSRKDEPTSDLSGSSPHGVRQNNVNACNRGPEEKEIDLTLECSTPIVDWEGENDSQHPQNWPSKKKWTYIILVSGVTFVQAMSSTALAPAVPYILNSLHCNDPAIQQLLVSIFAIGLAIGPIIFSPLSELYGRTPLMHASNLMFLVSAVACAVSVNIPMLLVFRLFMGISNTSLGAGYVADLMRPGEVSKGMNVWTIGPVMAPVLGPIAGGYIVLKSSWRWTVALIAFPGAGLLVACYMVLEETYPPRILELKAIKIRKEGHGPNARSKYHTDKGALQLLQQSLVRPLKMLFLSPIVALASLMLAVAYSIMYLMFSTFTLVFQEMYGFNSGQAGLTYIGIGVGSLMGQYFLNAWFRKRYLQHKLRRHGNRPEDQLPPLILAGLFMAAGLSLYGWSLQAKFHWMVPIAGTVFCGISIIFSFLAIQTYLVEVYPLHSASAVAASTLVRCIFGLTVPLAAPQLYKTLGLGWGNSLLGFLSLLVSPATLWLMTHGRRIREDPRFNPKL